MCGFQAHSTPTEKVFERPGHEVLQELRPAEMADLPVGLCAHPPFRSVDSYQAYPDGLRGSDAGGCGRTLL